MKQKNILMMVLLLVIVFISTNCTDYNDNEEPGELKLALSEISDTLSIDEKDIVLKTYMWRDFQPISPENGKALIIIFRIITVDSTSLPDGIDADAAWIICKDGTWETYITDDEIPEWDQQPYKLCKIARNGPKFGPNIYADVVVRIFNNNITYYLKAENQYIGRTE